RSFIEAGQWRKAAASCKNWLKSRNTLPLIRVFYAEALRNMQKYQAAANHLKLALKESPAELEYWYASIMVSWEAGDYKYLQRALNKATALGGDQDLIKRFTVLHNARTSKNTKDLIGELQDAIRTLGPEPEIMYCLADAFLKIGLLDEALGWYKKTITLKKNHERAYLGQIAALEALIAEGNIKKDEHKNLDSLYKAYLELWPSNSSIRRDRAIFLLKTLDFEEAAAELERLLAFEPGKYSLRRVLSYAYRKIGRYREAAVYLKALLREKPDDMMLLIEYSHCIDRAGAPAYAMTILQKAMGYFPPNANLSIAGGILCMRQRKLQEAYEYFREAALLSPEDARPEQWMKICQNEIKKRRNTKK
ncbi:MAG: tetratricopeptide repeat protein, partial [Treponema sp.]|nr:tetratricopeptide repeat protein [Treponema sp.]